jgi:hypothetical protein
MGSGPRSDEPRVGSQDLERRLTVESNRLRKLFASATWAKMINELRSVTIIPFLKI